MGPASEDLDPYGGEKFCVVWVCGGLSLIAWWLPESLAVEVWTRGVSMGGKPSRAMVQ
jgi:hypothetical protein